LIGWVWLLWVPAQSLAGENCKLGVQVKAHQFGMQIVVEGVDSGSPAEKAGLRRGDQLLMVGNVATFGTKSIEEMKSALDATPCGEVIRVMFRRNGIPQTVDIQLGSAGEQDSAKEPGSATSPTGIASAKPVDVDPNSPSPEAVAVGMAALQAGLGATQNMVADASAQARTSAPSSSDVLNWFSSPVPSDYPPYAEPPRILPLSSERARECSEEVQHLKKLKPVEFPQGYSLGRASFEGEAGRRFATALLAGVEVGGAPLSFYLMTPYSAARYRFYQAKKQFESLAVEDVTRDLGPIDTAIVVVTQDADVERLAANMAGFGSLVYNKLITKVVVKRGEIVYQPLGNQGAGWAFPLQVFAGEDDLEIIAVSSDNRQATVILTPSELDSYR